MIAVFAHIGRTDGASMFWAVYNCGDRASLSVAQLQLILACGRHSLADGANRGQAGRVGRPQSHQNGKLLCAGGRYSAASLGGVVDS